MATPRIELFWWARTGETQRFHVIRDIDMPRAYWTGCGMFIPMSLLDRPGTIVSERRPLDRDALCRRCLRSL